MKNSITLIFFLCLSGAIFSQPLNKSTANSLRNLGDELWEVGDFYNALDQYMLSYEEERDDEVQYKIAACNYNIRSYAKAAKRYKSVFKKDKEGKYEADRLNYARALKITGEYDDAIEQYQLVLGAEDDMDKQIIIQKEITGTEMAKEALETLGLTVERLDNRKINSKQSEYSPVYDIDGETMYFASFAKNEPIVLDGTNEDDITMKIYKATRKDEDKWNNPEELSLKVNREDYFTGNVNLSPDGREMYFTRALIDPASNLLTESKLYMATRADEGWSAVTEIQGANGNFLAKHPAVGELFGREVLFFVSNMDGGYGGFDIYYSTRKGDGVFGDPVNLGPTINSELDDETPFYKDGNLYFSSVGHPGFGGYDIFYSTWNGTKWSKPENMGQGYNSSYDDLYFSLDQSGYKGFIASNREGTKSVESSTCCNDIFELYIAKVEASLISSIIDQDKKALGQADVQLVEMTNNKMGATDKKNTGKNNKASFALELDKAYRIIATKEGYFPDTIDFNTVDLSESKEFTKTLSLEKKPEPPKPKEPEFDILTINQPIELQNIFYDFDDDKILIDAEKDLTVIMDLMNKYPEMKILLTSHTDSQGKDSYNEQLSQRRASSAKRWLIKNGINAARIRAQGKGEKEIRNRCENGVKCDDDEHRFNRRTEFTITEGPTTIQIEKKQFKKN